MRGGPGGAEPEFVFPPNTPGSGAALAPSSPGRAQRHAFLSRVRSGVDRAVKGGRKVPVGLASGLEREAES